MKVSRNRIQLAYTLEELLKWLEQRIGATVIDMTVDDSLLERSLPQTNADPFDPILVCQALSRNLVLVTPDKHLHAYPITCLW
ncbi:MAG TPA: hypothetical protein VG944_20955 [Fimbriimonas sp.]|nr:hypothetical protein [Fimbriimonas sp.]